MSVGGKGALSWDEPVTEFVSDVIGISDDRVHANPLVSAITVGLGLAVLALTARRALGRRLRPVVFAVIAVAGTVATTELAKLVVSRPVIEGSGEGSFPSGTAAWTFVAAAVSVLLLDGRRRRWAITAAAIVVVGTAAVIVWERWHYPSDVVGGWLLAGGWVGLAWLASEREGRGRLLGEHPPDRE